MQIEVLTLRYDAERGTIDGAAMAEFTRDKVVLGVREHFYQVGSTPHVTLVIQYRQPASAPAPPPAMAAAAQARRTSPAREERAPSTDELRDRLSAEERECFDRLRQWRAGLARDEGVPAYAILTNAARA